MPRYITPKPGRDKGMGYAIKNAVTDLDRTQAFSLLADQIIGEIKLALKKHPEGIIYEYNVNERRYVKGSMGAIVEPILTTFQSLWYVDVKISSHSINHKSVDTRLMVISLRLKPTSTEKGVNWVLARHTDVYVPEYYGGKVDAEDSE
ncbi:hypothetical protein M316_0002 [Nitrincola phage 1M3-16]|uniref:hypothetical protein n=1 Tax=Nitrincola phage 1M3-16 TaxID=1472912 RepID=UPI000444CC81|nr:hypothetical protein GJ22_gp002 [Nitrincola phage 1M3-16]AHX01067.1 hypothetical protein M316_0002 [Nitrincola phage 1M3-16]